jgi:hypothetical protein
MITRKILTVRAINVGFVPAGTGKRERPPEYVV